MADEMKYCKWYNDLHEFTNSWWKARRLYRKAKKMYYSAFIVRNEKHKDRKAEVE